jgi:group II intron reverse transcriptase/maturase
MKEREQNIAGLSGQSAQKVELHAMIGMQTFMGITENRLTAFKQRKDGLLEYILSPSNLNSAYKRVKSNKGSGGVDKMEVAELLPYLQSHKDSLIESIYAGSYHPNPVRRVEIPKSKGKTRSLGIPTVVDRVIQQAIAQQLQPLYEPQFSPSSYGFRPHRSTHDALLKCGEYISGGYVFTVDMDLEKFFDTVCHSKLIEILSRTVKDGRVVSWIHKYLNAGVMTGSRKEPTPLGVSQGSPLSPLLGNIMLNELDRELEKRGHRFVRYADDLVIFCKSRRSAQRTLDNLLPFIEKKLFLKVNMEKTKVAYMRDIKFLSYAFGRRNGICQYYIHPESIRKMKAKIRELTSRNNGWSYTYRKQRLTWYIRGWLNYFKLAGLRNRIRDWDGWLRRRIRMCIWKSWKRVRTRYRNLKKLVADENRVRQAAFAVRCIGEWLPIRQCTKPCLMNDYYGQVIQLFRCTIIRCSKVN